MTSEKKAKTSLSSLSLPDDSDTFEEKIIDGISYKVPRQHSQYVPIKPRNSFPDVQRPGYFRYWFTDADYQAEIAPYVARGFRKVEDVAPVYAGYVLRGREVMHVLYEIPMEIYKRWKDLEFQNNYERTMRNITNIPASSQRNTNFYATTESQEDLIMGSKVIRRK